ncbi:DUF3375 domain-containing protein [Nocardia nepalensis]|uniref:DUF3375 domain-containing protein n=1 Tax=Nocardia nepalensis TaxID=3375448 RepID=UPI003B683B6F
MSDISGELARVRKAFDKPTLKLLGKTWAPVVLATFTSTFTRDDHTVPAERFHARVDTLLNELRANGVEVPDKTAKELCRSWVRDQWLVLAPGEDAAEEYSLTSHTQEAIDYVTRSAGGVSTLSQSRILSILEAARRCALDANPDREAHLARLNADIERLTAERDRISAGGPIEHVPDERVLEGYINLRDLIDRLPADFLRVSEAVKAMHREILSEFRKEGRRTGEVLDRYLDRSRDLMSESAEGRAFTGAVELLRDEALLKQLRDDLTTILDHPFSQALTPVEAQEFRSTVAAIRRGLRVVLDQRRRVSSTLQTHITRHQSLRDRELDDALRRAKSAMATWIETAGPRAKIPIELGLPAVDIGHLRLRLYNPADHAPPPPLQQSNPVGLKTVSLDELRQQGGPSLTALRAHVCHALASAESVTAAEVFSHGDPELRRPVEILGLLHIAAGLGKPAQEGEQRFDAIRPDGSTQSFTAPRIDFHRDDISSLVQEDDTERPSQ